MRIDKDKDYKLEWRKAMDELVNLRQEYRELKEDRVYIKSLLDAEFKKGVKLKKENEQLKETNEKLQWELDKTREDLNYFTNLKVGAMRRSDCGHNRYYVTSMQKKGD